MSHHPLAVALLVLLVAGPAFAAVDTSYLEDHARTRGFMLGRPVRPKFTPDGKSVLFLRALPRKARMSLFEFDVASGKTRELLTPEKLLAGAEEKLTPEEKARRERQRVSVGGFATYQLSPDGANILTSLSGKLYLVKRSDLAVTELRTGKGTLVDPKFSPDGRRVAYVLDHDLYAMDLSSKKETRVTKGGTEANANAVAEFVAQEEMARFTGYWWSPDGKQFAYQSNDATKVENWYVADPAHPERPGTPSFYPRPGKDNVAVTLHVVGSTGGKAVPVTWDAKTYPYLANVHWDKRGGLTLAVQTRDQQELVLLAADPKSGKTKVLLTERDPAWLNLNHDKPHHLDDGSFLWAGEGKEGRQLELRDTAGKLIRVVVPASEGFKVVVDVNDAKGQVVYSASTDPTQEHLWVKTLADGKTRKLSDAVGLHSAVVSKDGTAFVHTESTLAALPRSSVKTIAGETLGELASVAESPPFAANQTVIRVGKGQGFYTAMISPRKMTPGCKYPVVVHVYGGPGHQEVLAQMNRRLIDQWMADQGFVVVAIDGRGTPGRGRDWERATYKNFTSLALEDQVAALKAMTGDLYAHCDFSRVGIYGWSFGGTMSALAALRRGDVFKAAVAGAPVTDWLDYDTHYTERYLGVPKKEDDAAYVNQSLLKYAKDLKTPLLLVHGTADDNVYFRHSLKLADALFREGRDFDILPLSGLTHQLPDPVVTRRLYGKIAEYFRKHLGTPGPIGDGR